MPAKSAVRYMRDCTVPKKIYKKKESKN
ncbi:hypothetical protein Bhyg_06872 [Pseudolycoriella hygida]|uniref:Uncharacterized protein n=1 Tax=Pseudolycoriella hygida TaxID=35572 RepID=A0A9Q0N2R3_9DIPT|nr:hypothetical protein Bhyg_06872 [Pseudolycoriella hygida]